MKMKLEMAKFLQDTLEELSMETKKKGGEGGMAAEFAEFMKKVLIFCYHTQKRRSYDFTPPKSHSPLPLSYNVNNERYGHMIVVWSGYV